MLSFVRAEHPFGATGVVDRVVGKKRSRQLSDLAESEGAVLHLDRVEDLINLMSRMWTQILEERASNPATSMSMIKNLFYCLLDLRAQRSFFFYVLQHRPAPSYVSSIFGSPPYAFLRSEDASSVQADSISRSRSNMTYAATGEANFVVASYSQFGVPMLVDQFRREYKLTSRATRSQLGANLRQVADDSNHVYLQCRIKRVTRERRLELLRTEFGRESLSFPRPGSNLVLIPSTDYLQLQSKALHNGDFTFSLPALPNEQQMTVKIVRPRAHNANTAELVGAV